MKSLVDVQSIDSYWFSVFERKVDNFSSLGHQHQHLFALFTADSIAKIKSHLGQLSEESGDGLKHLKSIHGLTNKNVFQGYVLQLEYGGIDFETFYRIETNKNIETITNHYELERQESFNQSICLREHHEFFFKYLTNIHVSRRRSQLKTQVFLLLTNKLLKISTDLDLKEMRPKNYANLISVSDSPLLVINFQNRLQNSIVLRPEWIDPLGESL